MGRQRNLQTQSARLFYKEHDHREIILNGEYINAVYVPSDSEEYMDKDVAWRKYKPLTLLGGAQFDLDQLVSVDVKNKFVSFSKDQAASLADPYNYGDEFVKYSNLISKNGYDYKYLDPEGEHQEASNTYFRFAEKYACEYEYDAVNYTHTIRWTGWDWAEGEQYAQVVPIGSITMTDSERKTNLTLCGEARDGLFAGRAWSVRITEQYPYTYQHYIELYHINSSGFNLVYTDTYTDSSINTSRLYPMNILSHGGKYCGMTIWGSTQTSGVRLWYSTTGDSWSYYDLLNQQGATHKPNDGFVVYRNNAWYFYVRLSNSNNTEYKWVLFYSGNLITFVSRVLPRYIDIPMLGYDDGIHGDIDDCDGEYVRIILNNFEGTIPAEQGTTYYIHLNAGQFYCSSVENQKFFSIEDGKICYDPPSNFLYGFYTDPFEDYLLFFYVNNMTLQSNAPNFAFKKSPPEEPWLQENHEIVASDDYVWTPPNNI